RGQARWSKPRSRRIRQRFWISRSEAPMSADFYCDDVFSGKTPVGKVLETENVLAYHHTRPFWDIHIVVVPKAYVDSLLTVENDLLIELLDVAKNVAAKIVEEKGAARL